jgi:RimJ/RimL family protein N-acetyltransferase
MDLDNAKSRDIITSRLILRSWRSSDLAPFATMGQDPEVMRYFPSLLDQAQSDAMANRCQELIEMRGWGFWAAEERSSGEFVGFIGLHVPSDALPFSPCVEVGWRLARQHWGKGLASEGARAALDFGFETIGLEEIVSFTALVNLRSQAVMERIGMERQAQTFRHPAIPDDHELAEHCLYKAGRPSW